jgi:hypothetical protein
VTGRGRRPFDPLWVFLARGRFAAKTLINGYLISLDFLGFSRPKRDLSMGYTRLSLEVFSSRFSLTVSMRRRERQFSKAKGQICSSGQLSLVFDFSQSN